MLFNKRSHGGERLDRVAMLYLGYKFFGALYFGYPIFYEYASQTITPIEVGLFFSAIGAVGLLAEIPTGIIADKRSRKFSALFGMAMATIAPLIIFLSHNFAAYLVAALFYGLGRAFLNGALDSLVYDHKNVSKSTYRRVNTLEITFGQAGILVSAACGGVMFSVNRGLPFVAEVVAGIVCLGLIAAMSEQYKPGHIKAVVSHKKHFTESVRHLTATRHLRVLVLMAVTFSVMLGMCIQFVHEAAMIEYGLQATARGFLVSGVGVLTLIVLNVFLLKLVRSDAVRIIYMSCGAFAAYALMGTGFMPLFLCGYLLWCCLNATSSFLRVMVQDQIPGSHRATILSSYKTLATVVGLGASTGTGLLVQWAHAPRVAYLLFGVVALGVLVPCGVWLVVQLKRQEMALGYVARGFYGD